MEPAAGVLKRFGREALPVRKMERNRKRGKQCNTQGDSGGGALRRVAHARTITPRFSRNFAKTPNAAIGRMPTRNKAISGSAIKSSLGRKFQ